LINADAKPEALRPRLPYPHSSAVAGADRLRELRPGGGRSPVAGSVPPGRRRVRGGCYRSLGRSRSAGLHGFLSSGRGPSGEAGARQATKKQTRSKTASSLAAEEACDAEVADELARTAVANQLAILVIQDRADHDLTRTALARKLEMRQPAVARLEAGNTSRRWPHSCGLPGTWGSPCGYNCPATPPSLSRPKVRSSSLSTTAWATTKASFNTHRKFKPTARTRPLAPEVTPYS